MKETPKVLFLLCGRNGSKGVPNKNVRPVLGKPLMMYTVEGLKECGFYTHLVVSTDGDPIKSAVKGHVDLVIDRPSELATDTIGRWPTLKHALESCEKQFDIRYDYVFDFLVTAPLRRVEDLNTCFELIQQDAVSNVITATPSHRSPYFNMVEVDPETNAPVIVKAESGPFFRRQDAPETYDMNGSIYAWKRDVLLEGDNLFLKKTKLHIMPSYTSIDIDTEEDFEYLEFILNKRNG